MLHRRGRTAAGEQIIDPPLESLHTTLADPQALTWRDVEAPTADEVALVAGLARWDHLTVEDLTHYGQRAKLEAFPSYHYLVMHALEYDGTPPRLSTAEGNFVVGPHYVASIHQELAGTRVLLEEDPVHRVDDRGRRLYYAYTPDGVSLDEGLVRARRRRAVRTEARYGDYLAALQAVAEADGRGCLWHRTDSP